jgi:muramoyltetrapeptide carboxypeptidase
VAANVPIKPPRLNYGDTIGIIAPASAPPDPKAIDRSVEAIERLGFRPKLATNVRRRWGFLAGSDRERAADLMRMYLDRKVKAIVCVRGGYGTARLLPLLDYEKIRTNAKIFIGYSDITSLHCAFLVKANLISFHGPMLNSEFIKDDLPEFTLRSFLRTLMEPIAPGSITSGLGVEGRRKKSEGRVNRPEIRILRSGKASGQLIGGNLSLICTTLATPYQPSFKNRILFLEDLDEVPFRFDRMLTHLLNAGLLQQVAGIAIGTNKDCIDPKAKGCNEYRQTMEDVFKERLAPLKVPVVLGLPFGHVPLNATLPVGVKATLDGNKGDLVIEDSGVK